ncbi:unnamed protein product, partial [Amoebophrya sp. A25]
LVAQFLRGSVNLEAFGEFQDEGLVVDVRFREYLTMLPQLEKSGILFGMDIDLAVEIANQAYFVRCATSTA